MFLIEKALADVFNQEKAQVGAFSVIVKSSQTSVSSSTDYWGVRSRYRNCLSGAGGQGRRGDGLEETVT